MHNSPHFLHETLHPPARLVAAGAYAAAQGHDYPPHKHHMWEIVCYRSGHIPTPIGDAPYECAPGVVLLTPPGVIHAEYATTAYSNYWVQIDAPSAHPWPRMCRDDNDHSFEHVCGALAREHNRQGLDRDAMIDLLLHQLLILIERAKEQHQLSSAERLVREVESFFEEHYATQIAMHDVARVVGIAPSTLRAHFVQVRGISPLAALQRIRVQHAIGQIRNTTLTLEAIATLCGYDSASHLSRYIKRETGKRSGALRCGDSVTMQVENGK